jgi:hypothetical protein
MNGATRFLFTLLLVASGACSRPEDGRQTIPSEIKVDESTAYHDPIEQASFESALKAAKVPHTIEFYEGRRAVAWKAEHSEAVKRIQMELFGEPFPPGAGLSPSPDLRDEFKAWLKENSVPYTTHISRGREYIMWEETYTPMVRTWKHFPPPPPARQAPNPSIERTSPGKPGAASHVKR